MPRIGSLRARRILGAAVALLAIGAAPPLDARPAWLSQPYPYLVIAQDAQTVFAEFGRNLRVPVQLSRSVRGRIKGPLRGVRAGDFLDSVGRAGGLAWYFDGFVLHVSAQSEHVTRLLGSPKANAAEVVRQARALGLADGRFLLSPSANGRVLRVSGPPAYVAAIEQLAQQLEASAGGPAAGRRLGSRPGSRKDPGGETVRIFRGTSGVEIRSLPGTAR